MKFYIISKENYYKRLKEKEGYNYYNRINKELINIDFPITDKFNYIVYHFINELIPCYCMLETGEVFIYIHKYKLILISKKYSDFSDNISEISFENWKISYISGSKPYIRNKYKINLLDTMKFSKYWLCSIKVDQGEYKLIDELNEDIIDIYLIPFKNISHSFKYIYKNKSNETNLWLDYFYSFILSIKL